MTSGTVPSPPEASTHGAGTRKRAGQGATAKTGGARQDTRLVNLVLTGENEGLIDRVRFVRLAQSWGDGETEPYKGTGQIDVILYAKNRSLPRDFFHDA